MAIFNKKEGGLMDVIRCDETDYLIWKWRPAGEANTTNKENAIRWGSSLRVKDGEVAVFVYKQKDGQMQDFILGPFDETIKTKNFPIISGIIGLAFAGKSPFQAEVYFINLAGNVPLKFGVPYFDVADPRPQFMDMPVPVAVRGTINFNITDYEKFIKLNRLINFEFDDLRKRITDAIRNSVKRFVPELCIENQIPVLTIERRIGQVNDRIEARLKDIFSDDFGINLKRMDISDIEIDKESEQYSELKRLTAGIMSDTLEAQSGVNIKNMQDMQNINAGNMEETLRIQREEMQRAQKLQTEGQNISVHQLNQQTDVAKTAAESMGQMGSGTGGGTMDPGSMMASMAMGTAVGGGMAGMMGNMMQGMNQQQNTPPPPPSVQYMVSVAGQQAGPYNFQQLQEYANSGQLTKETFVWKQGMANWIHAGNVQELAPLFLAQAPPPPPPAP